MKHKITFLVLMILLFLPAATKIIHAQGTIIISPTEVPDTDGDGLPDDKDKCPNESGPRTNGGCPEGSGSDGRNPSDGNDNPSDDNNPNPDSDGDGLSDSDDQCPTVGGPTWNGGCPEGEPDPNATPTTMPDPNDRPPFEPPALPSDGCYITARVGNNINVRQTADLGGAILGWLIPGKVYEAMGYVVVGTDVWFKLNTYEGFAGTTGYSSRTVLLVNNDCPDVTPSDSASIPTSADDFATETNDPEVLCFLSVGFDAPTWSNGADMASIHYASFYFEWEPGEPLPAGTPIWGVISMEPFISLPDYINVFAVAPNPQIFAEAVASGAPNTYNWPTLAGGIQSGDTILYRLTDDVGSPDANNGRCGPIVGDPDDLTTIEPTVGDPFISIPIDQYACTVTTSYDLMFAFSIAPGEVIPVGTAPTAILHTDYATGSATSWYTAVEVVDGQSYEYMVSPVWASLVRTGGTCGPIGAMRR